MRRPIIYEDEKLQKLRIKRRASALRSAAKKKESECSLDRKPLEDENLRLKKHISFLETKISFLEGFLGKGSHLSKKKCKSGSKEVDSDHLGDMKIAYSVRPHQGTS